MAWLNTRLQRRARASAVERLEVADLALAEHQHAPSRR